MPEHAEVRLNADLLNTISNRGALINKIQVNPVIKHNRQDLDEMVFGKDRSPIVFSAESRGKELAIDFEKGNSIQRMVFTLGMSGAFGVREEPSFENHDHVWFQFSNSPQTLVYNDVRRFGRWDFRTWKDYRSPDPVFEFDAFKENILNNLDSKPFTNKDIGSVLMNQKYFNGLGVYLVSTILYHTNQNPFQNAAKAIQENTEILPYCKFACEFAYRHQGGQFSTWKNPFEGLESEVELNQDFAEWKYYKDGLSCKTKSRRPLWFDPKWKSECPYEIR
mgnify:CR=1 FL=1